MTSAVKGLASSNFDPISLANNPNKCACCLVLDRSLVNKMDEMKLRMIVSSQVDSCVAIVPETWQDNNIPDVAVELAGRSLFSGRTGLQPQRNTEVEV
ncbi:hypothetical protein L3Q82_002981 [Scortum barcoo]|uniref:Uncharacterized protein n=1 Tax=Scortum barcoo TaxID=214431 RepID=A0ACB8VRH0_9TELE|nr:hypothetical protein L3Q82_002981 [Scortum barcoo]